MNLELTPADKKILNAALWLFWTYAHDRHNEIAQDRDNRLTFKDKTLARKLGYLKTLRRILTLSALN